MNKEGITSPNSYNGQLDNDIANSAINNDPKGSYIPNELVSGSKEDANSFESIAKERELTDYIKNQIIYTGLFVDPDEIYDKFPPSLSHKIRDPHITVSYRPGAERVFLDALDSGAKIRAVGYGNNGKNEGLLVEVIAEDPAIQKNLNERVAPDKTGEIKPVPIHITLSITDGAEAVNTKNLDFSPLETPVDLTGNYKLFAKDGTLISDKDTVKKMYESGFEVQEIEDPDRP